MESIPSDTLRMKNRVYERQGEFFLDLSSIPIPFPSCAIRE